MQTVASGQGTTEYLILKSPILKFLFIVLSKNEEIFGVTWLSGSLVLLSAADDVISVFLDALEAFKLFLPSHLSNQRFCKLSREL